MTINMKEFTGENDSAAGGLETQANSYQQEIAQDEVSVDQGILNQVNETRMADAEKAIDAPIPEPSKQELNFQALREEVERLKHERDAERNEFRQNLELFKANLQQPVAQAPREEPKKFLDGLSETDVPNVAEIRQAFEQREQQYQLRLEELEIQSRHPDYVEVLEKFTAPLLKQKPHLAQGFNGAVNKAMYAYELGKMAQGAMQTAQAPVSQQTSPSETAQKIVENARKPASLAQAGGTSRLSQADFYANMSDAEFIKMASKNLGEI